MLTRRGFVGGGICCCLSESVRSDEPELPGCVFFEAPPSSNMIDPNDAPGLAPIDFSLPFENALVIALNQLSELFQVRMAFGYYDDDVEYPNARPIRHTTLRGLSGVVPSDGGIIIGRHLVTQIRERELGTPNFGAAMTAVCAHETGHLLQYKYVVPELMRIPDHVNMRAELHADFISGYFGAIRKRQQADYPAVIQAMTQFRYGDGSYVVVQHGSPLQRGDAVHAGFVLGQGPLLPPKEVTVRGLEYVMNLVL